MKVEFSRSVEYVPTFGGNKDLPEDQRLVAVCQVMDMQDFFNIMEVMQGLGFSAGDERSLSAHQMATLAKNAGHYIPKYVEFRNNENFAVQDVPRYPVFFALSAELLFQLVSIASPSEQDVKN